MSEITQDMIDCWRINYGLDKRSPSEAMRYWHELFNGMAPAGAVGALGTVLDELDSLRRDAERYRWLQDQSGQMNVGPPGSSRYYFRIAGEFNPMSGFLDEAIDRAAAAIGTTKKGAA